MLLLQVRHVFAGTAARTMAQALIHPLDTVKTRLQVPVPIPAWLLRSYQLLACKSIQLCAQPPVEACA